MSFLPYARLMRLPNVFTSFADIALGLCVAIRYTSSERMDAEWWLRSLCLFLASGCLYIAGMVWNDYFDLDEDRRDRPFRPLASGRISIKAALRLGSLLMMAGIGFAFLSGCLADGRPRETLVVAICLATAIILYDSQIKRTPFGPIGMASCRFLNVLLGLTLVDTPLPSATKSLLAGIVGVYIIGVTWFARTEEKRSESQVLGYAAVMMALALLATTALPWRVGPSGATDVYPYALAAAMLWIGGPVWRAIRDPKPGHVQAGVKRGIFGLVALDALMAGIFIGWPGLLILMLLLPAIVVGKWVYST